MVNGAKIAFFRQQTLGFAKKCFLQHKKACFWQNLPQLF